jgi:hypothetical protein
MKLVALAILLTGILFAGTAATEAQGQNGRYCLRSWEGFTNCGFSTRAQCEKARRGVSAAPCTVNPQYRRRR